MTLIYLAELTCATDSAGTISVERFGTMGYNTLPSDTPASTHYAPRIKQPALIQRDMYANGKAFGRSSIGYGELVLANADGGLDYLMPYGVDGRAITIKLGDSAAAYSTFTTVLSATMEQIDFSDKTATVRLKDKMLLLDKPVAATLYAGTNVLPAGIEGTADIKGKNKPLLLGNCTNVAGVLCNTSKLIYQVSSAAVNAISAVYDRGAALTVGTTYTSQADMEANAPASGNFRAWPAGGCFRLGSSPTGQVTADVTQGAAAANRTTAQVLSALASAVGVTAYAADVTALDAINSAEVGIYIDDNITASDAMDAVAASIGAWYGFDSAGNLRMGQLQSPSGVSVASLTKSEIISIARITARDETKGLPAWRVQLGYLKYWTVQGTDLAGAVTADRRALLAEQYRTSASEDAAVKTQYLMAPTVERNGLLVSSSAAATESARLLALLKVKRDTYDCTVRTSDIASLDIGKVITITHPRYGLSGGKQFVILGLRADFQANAVQLTIWG